MQHPNHTQRAVVIHLKHRQTGLVKRVKGGPGLVGRELAAENLHAQQGKDEDKEHEEDEQGVDGGDRVDQRLDQVAHGGPVPGGWPEGKRQV